MKKPYTILGLLRFSLLIVGFLLSPIFILGGMVGFETADPNAWIYFISGVLVFISCLGQRDAYQYELGHQEEFRKLKLWAEQGHINPPGEYESFENRFIAPRYNRLLQEIDSVQAEAGRDCNLPSYSPPLRKLEME